MRNGYEEILQSAVMMYWNGNDIIDNKTVFWSVVIAARALDQWRGPDSACLLHG